MARPKKERRFTKEEIGMIIQFCGTTIRHADNLPTSDHLAHTVHQMTNGFGTIGMGIKSETEMRQIIQDILSIVGVSKRIKLGRK